MNEKILIVDDRTDSINLITDALDMLGYVSYKANTGKECLSMLNKKDVDLIILDIMLPDISGKDVLKKIRKDKANNKTKVIMLTAIQHTRKQISQYSKLGAQGFLNKPISINILEKEIKKVLKK